MKRITLLFSAIFIAFTVFSQQTRNLELIIIPKSNDIGIYKELWLNTYLVNNSSEPIKMFKVGACEDDWHAYEDVWQGTINGKPMEFYSFSDAATSKFSANSFVDVMPGDSVYAGLLRYKIIAGGEYSIIYTLSQAPEKVNINYSSSIEATAKATQISKFSVTSKPFNFSIAESELGSVEIKELSDEELAKAPTINNIEQAFSKPSEAYKLDISGNITDEVMLKICKLKNLKELSLSNIKGITKLPTEINQLKLSKLVIYKTELEYPDGMKNMTSLKDLSYSNMQFTKLPDFVKHLNNIESLEVSYSPITEIPAEIKNFKNLKSVILINTEIISLGTILSEASMLEMLSISGPLNSFPDISGCKNLKKLNLSNCKQITLIPPTIGNFTKLEEINFAITDIAVIPPEIARLEKLKRLTMPVTKITAIPAELYECTLLEYLDISRSQVNTCAAGIDKLKNLQEIYLYDNQITQLPVGLSKCMNLTYVNVHTNKIKESDKEGKILADRIGKKYRAKK
jgi:hypothetical protein